jgi:hypothetical protein
MLVRFKRDMQSVYLSYIGKSNKDLAVRLSGIFDENEYFFLLAFFLNLRHISLYY